MSEEVLNESIQLRMNEIANQHTKNKIDYSQLYKKIVHKLSQPDFNINKTDQYSHFIENTRKISSTNNKIRSSIYSINNLISLTFSSDMFKTLESDFIFNCDTAIMTTKEINKLLMMFGECTNQLLENLEHKSPVSYKITSVEKIKPGSHLNSPKGQRLSDIVIERAISVNFDRVYKTNQQINDKTLFLIDIFTKIKSDLTELNYKISEGVKLDYIQRFKEDTDLILKKYEVNLKNLTNKLENRISNINLNHTELVNSNTLLKNSVETGLKNIGKLNERTQKIELEFSNILNVQTEKVEKELTDSKKSLMSIVTNIENEANVKLEGINTAHSDFLSIVSKSGAHELTKNYKEKAGEEKTEYQDFRKYTAWSIIAAIASTLLIFVIAFLEHYFAKEGDQTNYLLLASRLSISVMFFVLAFYLSKQAAKHYECYQENHRTFLQLAALEPFMARMSADEQMEIRKGLIPSYFNQNADGKFAAKGDEVDLPTNIHAIVNRAFDLVGEKKEPKTAENTATDTKPVV